MVEYHSRNRCNGAKGLQGSMRSSVAIYSQIYSGTELFGFRRPMKAQVRDAFLTVRDRYPPDRVVADPQLNQAFISECRRLGLADSIKALNQKLLNLRKGGDLKGLRRSVRTSFRNEEEYRFASEIAARHLERQKNVTVDEIICDPELVREFDSIAADLAPGFLPLQYRWAAFNLRKAKRLKPELLSRVAPAQTVSLGLVTQLDVVSIS